MCLCEDCGNCKKILYEEEGEIEFDSDYVHDEEEWTFVEIDIWKVQSCRGHIDGGAMGPWPSHFFAKPKKEQKKPRKLKSK